MHRSLHRESSDLIALVALVLFVGTVIIIAGALS